MTPKTLIIPKPYTPISPKESLPTMYDLPSEEIGDSGLPDEFHLLQLQILQNSFKSPKYYPNHQFSAIDMNLYYDETNTLWYKRPDWFGVVGVSRFYEESDLRLSYVIWQEQISPFIVVELLSPGTENEDLGLKKAKAGKPPTKWQVYEEILKVPYYVVFSRYTNEMQAFHLEGNRYQKVELTNNRLRIPSIELSLGLWHGNYDQIERLWLRWMTLEGDLIPLPTEEAEIAKKRAINAEERAEYLAAKLRELNINPDDLK